MGSCTCICGHPPLLAVPGCTRFFSPFSFLLFRSLAMSAVPAFEMSPGSTLGACFIGFLFAAILYGITCMQTHHYFARKARKEPVLKSLVLLLWVLGTVHISFIAIALYHYLVNNFANPAALLLPFWSLPSMVAMSCVIECIVRGVFIHKVWILSQNRWLAGVLCFMNCGVVAVGILFTREAFLGHTFNEIFTNSTWIVLSAFLTDFLLNLCISASIALSLRRVRQGCPSTTQFVDKIIYSALKTGVLTAAMSLAVLTLFVQNRYSFAFMAMYFPFAQVFFATLLASLNMRRRARDIEACACSHPVKKAPFDTERGASVDCAPPSFRASSSGSIVVLIQDHERGIRG